jgi:hypothetical protein
VARAGEVLGADGVVDAEGGEDAVEWDEEGRAVRGGTREAKKGEAEHREGAGGCKRVQGCQLVADGRMAHQDASVQR